MKKLTMLALLFFMVAGMANAQLRYGIKGGANLTDILTKNGIVVNVDKAIHYQAGFVIQYKIGNFAIQPELLYSEKGGKLKDVYPNSSFLSIPTGLSKENPDISFVSRNIELPVNLQFGLSIGKTRVYVQGGPYLSYLLTGQMNGDKQKFTNVDKVFAFNAFDFGLGAGAGVEYKKFQLSAKYDFGLNPIGKEVLNPISDVNINPFHEMKNRNLSVSLAYMF